MKQTPPGKCVGDEGGEPGGAEGVDGSPQSIGTPTTLSSLTDDCCITGTGQMQVPPQAPMPPPSMEMALGQEPLLSDGAPPAGGSHQGPAVAALQGLEKKEKNFTYLRHVMTCSKTKQDIEEPEVSMLKFKGIPGRGSSIIEETATNLTDTTTFHYEKDAEESGGALLKGISSPDPLSDCVSSTKTDGNADAIKDGQAVKNINVAKNLTQLFVKVCQKEMSMQEDFNTTTINELMDSTCRKAGIKACDFYATYGGKCLEADKPISYYPIFKDSTVHLRPRLRAGRSREYEFETFEELMSKNMGKRFRQVSLSKLSKNKKKMTSSVTFLLQFAAYYIQRIMVYVCGRHREGRSFNGEFAAKDILIINNTMVDFDTYNLPDRTFTKETCSNDYAKLYEIFATYFTEGGNTPVYFGHFLLYLLNCPAKEKSNSEPAIQFITNHPALTSYMDRIKQCVLLDSMVRRLDASARGGLAAIGESVHSWVNDVSDATALETVYKYKSKYDPITLKLIVNHRYTTHILGCLRFARNYFSHADYQMILLEVEAAFAQTLEQFLPTILQNMALDFVMAPADFDILSLLGNPLAAPFE